MQRVWFKCDAPKQTTHLSINSDLLRQDFRRGRTPYHGPVDTVSYESHRPIKVVWRLRHSMPVEMFEDNRWGG